MSANETTVIFKCHILIQRAIAMQETGVSHGFIHTGTIFGIHGIWIILFIDLQKKTHLAMHSVLVIPR